MSLTLKQMRYFDALATARHFGRAAELAHVSQPALSAQIVEMERWLGAKLVERGRRATFLTREGERLLPEIRAILSAVEELETSVRSAKSPLSGGLRLGVIPTVAPYLLPLLIPELRGRYPALDVELKETVTDTLIEDLAHGQLDAAVVALPVDGGHLTARPLFRDRFLIACADNEENVLMSPMTQEHLDASRLLLLEEGHCMREQALAVCRTTPKRRMVDFGATSMATLLEMVTHGLGLTLIPEIAVKAESQRHTIRIVPFAEPQPAREIGLISRATSGRDGDFDALAEVIETCARGLTAPDADKVQAMASRTAK